MIIVLKGKALTLKNIKEQCIAGIKYPALIFQKNEILDAYFWLKNNQLMCEQSGRNFKFSHIELVDGVVRIEFKPLVTQQTNSKIKEELSWRIQY
jgi:hypothetical protein